tara:strand:+ start:709 stop:1299 length:591 start_codon:yes stop_codon:yes gene_type:complete
MSQDLFADYMLDSNEGYFVDVGCYEPKYINNTYMLEQKGFKGLLLDIDPKWVKMAEQERSAKAVQVDLAAINFTDVLLNNECPKLIDYLDLDIDGATLKVLKDIDFELFTFKVITIEHDYYMNKNDAGRSAARDILKSNGYELVCADVGNNSGPQEDWYIHPNHIDQSRWDHVVCSDLKHTEVRKLMGITDEKLNW